jgi:NTP pyrophosphatase (non-canonical NTP hydrolase)
VKDVLNHAILKYGKDIQLDVAIEEMAELTKEIVKHKRGKNNHIELAEEIADVHIMLEQVKMACDITDHEVNIFIQQKIQGLKNKLSDENEI